MKTEEQEFLESEYNNSFCNCESSTIQHLKGFISDTSSSNLPDFLKEKFVNNANGDIRAIRSLLDLENLKNESN